MLGEEVDVNSETFGGHRPSAWDLGDGRYIFLWQTNFPYGYPPFEQDRVGYVVGRVVDASSQMMDDTFIIAAGVNLLRDAASIEVSDTGAISVYWTAYDLDDIYLDTYQSVYGGQLNDVVEGAESDDFLYGRDGDDTINGYEGDDVVYAGDGDDLANAGGGNDSVDGGAGNDLIVGGAGAGDDVYVGGEGADTVKYTSAVAAITANLATGVVTSRKGGDAAGIGTDQLSSIESVIGGHFGDLLIGDSSANVLQGMRGADSLIGGAGRDTLWGGNGGDVLSGGAGRDLLIGGPGSDTFRFDTHPAPGNADLIRGFLPSQDKILLDDAVFSAIGPLGALAPGAFILGVSASTEAHRVVFDSSTGRLFYDPDGSGEIAQILIARIAGLEGTLSAGDFGVL
jgi:serralysin